MSFQTVKDTETFWAAIAAVWQFIGVYQAMHFKVGLLAKALATIVAFKRL